MVGYRALAGVLLYVLGMTAVSAAAEEKSDVQVLVLSGGDSRIAGAAVAIKDYYDGHSKASGKTDSNGMVTLRVVTGSRINIRASAPGYEPASLDDKAIFGDPVFKITLRKSAVSDDPGEVAPGKCKTCKGSGKIVVIAESDDGRVKRVVETCSRCDGTGRETETSTRADTDNDTADDKAADSGEDNKPAKRRPFNVNDLRIYCDTEDVEVFLDGAKVGTTRGYAKPLLMSGLKDGEITIVAKHPEYDPCSIKYAYKQGRPNSVTLGLTIGPMREDEGRVFTDTEHRLTWVRWGDVAEFDAGARLREAKAVCAELNKDRKAGRDQWRLPTYSELVHLSESLDKAGRFKDRYGLSCTSFIVDETDNGEPVFFSFRAQGYEPSRRALYKDKEVLAVCGEK